MTYIRQPADRSGEGGISMKKQYNGQEDYPSGWGGRDDS